uniref:Tripartite motif containing 2 n=1 Tax=Bos indicus x Bos taurus TaxID=30522 RepID=A0A4W2H4H1_BOBOX
MFEVSAPVWQSQDSNPVSWLQRLFFTMLLYGGFIFRLKSKLSTYKNINFLCFMSWQDLQSLAWPSLLAVFIIYKYDKDVFQLKDMEKIAPKEKGITAMSVKEVLQSLVDDGMVDCERIGTSNYYWAFPSKALHARKRKLEVLDSQLSEGNQKYANLQKSIEKAKVGRHETEERTMLAKELSSLRDQREQLKAEVEKYRECDPQVVEEIRQANQVAKEAANRWTDNIFAIKSWAKRKFGFEENKIDKNFGIPEDFDYID